MDQDVVINRGMEWGNVGCWIVGNVAMQWDEAEEVLVYEFFLGVPKLLVILVNDCVLVRVVVVGGGASGDGEEMRKEVGGNRSGRRFNGKRWERSGCLWSGGTGQWYTVDGGEDDWLG